MAKHYKISDWKVFFEKRGVRQELVDCYLEYIDQLISADVPVIFEFDHLSALLGRTNTYLASVVSSPNSHYRTFRIPKRRKGYREISAPYPALLECQQWINRAILYKGRVHACAHGFISNKSIVSNAKPHLGQRCLLKMDLKDFFPSIPINRVINVFRQFGYPPNVSFYLARICCEHDRLPQGAATSPALSNIIAYGLDVRLDGIAKKYELNYSRYADDIAFSGRYIPIHYIQIVEKITREQGFLINHEKTHLCRSEGKRIVTGLSVATNHVKIPRQYKRKLRQEIHFINKYGYFSHVSRKKMRTPFYLHSIYGKLTFWLSIEPENSFAEKAADEIKKAIANI